MPQGPQIIITPKRLMLRWSPRPRWRPRQWAVRTAVDPTRATRDAARRTVDPAGKYPGLRVQQFIQVHRSDILTASGPARQTIAQFPRQQCGTSADCRAKCLPMSRNLDRPEQGRQRGSSHLSHNLRGWRCPPERKTARMVKRGLGDNVGFRKVIVTDVSEFSRNRRKVNFC